MRRRPAAAGRFNGGQKAHATLRAGLPLLFVVSGLLLWLGERNTGLRLPGTLALHDAATLLLAVLVGGHISKAISTAGSREGIGRGTVSARYAAQHHEKWRASPPVAGERRALTGGELAIAAVVLAAAVAAVTLLV